MFGERFAEYQSKLENSERQAEHLKRMAQRLYEFDDNQLRIACKPHGYTEHELNKDPCQGFYHNPAVSASALERRHPELAADPAFQKLSSAYKALANECYLNFGPHSYPQSEISRLATRMANRQTTENEYFCILNEEFACQQEASNIIGKAAATERFMDNIREHMKVC